MILASSVILLVELYKENRVVLAPVYYNSIRNKRKLSDPTERSNWASNLKKSSRTLIKMSQMISQPNLIKLKSFLHFYMQIQTDVHVNRSYQTVTNRFRSRPKLVKADVIKTEWSKRRQSFGSQDLHVGN